MFSLPSHPIPYRIVGVDPGSTTLGIAVLDLYLEDFSIELVDARTFNAARGISHYQTVTDFHGDRMARLHSLQDSLYGYLACFRPQGFASESPYMGRFANAFRALTECLLVIQQTAYVYDPRMRVHLIDPMTVKAAVGIVAKGYRNKAALAKEHVREAVLKLPLRNPGNFNMEAFDEHSIDAIAVAIARIKQMLTTG